MKTAANAASVAGATTLIVLLHDRHGSVERVLGATRRQGCTVTNLALERTGEHGLARVSLTIEGGQPTRLAQQLTRLVDVIDVRDATSTQPPDRATQSEAAPTPFHSQADGTTPAEGESDSPITPTED